VDPADKSMEASTPTPDPGMSAALRSVELLDVMSGMFAGPSVARLASAPDCGIRPAAYRRSERTGGTCDGRCLSRVVPPHD
jgi:hypothetical protein